VEVLQVKLAPYGLALGGLLLVLACGPKTVQGSLSVLMDMSYQTTDVVMGTSDVTVRFTRPSNDDGEGEDVVLAVSARGLTLPYPADAGTPIRLDLAEALGSGQRGALSRNVLNDPRNTFPEIERGQMVFYDIPAVGQTARGDFSVTFVLGQEFGNGRTLYDSFQGKVR
jgi:hypothetical protein